MSTNAKQLQWYRNFSSNDLAWPLIMAIYNVTRVVQYAYYHILFLRIKTFHLSTNSKQFTHTARSWKARYRRFWVSSIYPILTPRVLQYYRSNWVKQQPWINSHFQNKVTFRQWWRHNRSVHRVHSFLWNNSTESGLFWNILYPNITSKIYREYLEILWRNSNHKLINSLAAASTIALTILLRVL